MNISDHIDNNTHGVEHAPASLTLPLQVSECLKVSLPGCKLALRTALTGLGAWDGLQMDSKIEIFRADCR